MIYREAHILLEEITGAPVEGTRKALMLELTTVPPLIIHDLRMRKRPHTAAEDLLEPESMERHGGQLWMTGLPAEARNDESGPPSLLPPSLPRSYGGQVGATADNLRVPRVPRPANRSRERSERLATGPASRSSE